VTVTEGIDAEAVTLTPASGCAGDTDILTRVLEATEEPEAETVGSTTVTTTKLAEALASADAVADGLLTLTAGVCRGTSTTVS